MRQVFLLNVLLPALGLRMLSNQMLASPPETRGVETQSYEAWAYTCLLKSFKGGLNDDGPCSPPKHIGNSLSRKNSWSIDGGVELLPELKACNKKIRPLADFDEKAGHGNVDCRYEPSNEVRSKFKKDPEDIAILAPFTNERLEVPENPAELKTLPEFGVHSWRAYARFHNYSFYTGNQSVDATLCPGIEHRTPHWMKPCAAMQLAKKHKYLMIVDTDTYVAKPRLRLEPLFLMAGLLDESTGKTIAVAEEWGSCWGGKRLPISGGSNTGIIMLRRHLDTDAALRNWFNEPVQCIPEDKSLLQLQKVQDYPDYRGYGLIEGNWLMDDPRPERCKVLISLLRGWSWDQAGFHLSIVTHPTFAKLVHQLPAGCPVNSPWADFIPHLPSGTVAQEYYFANDRSDIFKNMHRCTAAALQQTKDDYARCALCDLLPENIGDDATWSFSCPNQKKVSAAKGAHRRTEIIQDESTEEASQEDPSPSRVGRSGLDK